MPARTFHHRAMHFVSPQWPDVQHILRYTIVKCSQRSRAFRTGCGRIVVRFGFGKIPVPHFKPSAATAKAYSCAMDSPKPSAHRGAAWKTPVAMAKLEQTCPTSEEMRSSPYNIHNDAKHKLSVTLLPCENAPRIASPFRAHFPVLLFDVLECHIASLLRTNAMCDINRSPLQFTHFRSYVQ